MKKRKKEKENGWEKKYLKENSQWKKRRNSRPVSETGIFPAARD
jgi:hypothetical protein